MKKLSIAIAMIVLTLTPGVALASTAADSHHGGGHGGGNAPVVEGARKIKVKAENLRFTPDVITVAVGEDVTIVMKSTDTSHDFVVKGFGHVVGADRKKTGRGGIRFDEPGTYKFSCSVAGHRSGGMKGTIVVA